MERVVVTGAAGFIGSHLAEKLAIEGYEVVAIDNLSRGKLDNLEPAKRRGSVIFHNADVADYDAIAPLFEGASKVFHLAALADIVPSINDPLLYHRSNVDGTASVMEAARSAGVKRVIYAASASCYGLPDITPTPESAAMRPQYPYALTKLLGEQIVLHWGEVYGLGVVTLRLFNVYGPRARTSGAYGAVFGVFLAQKLAGKPMTIVGDGTQTRDFTYVTDVADAFVAASKSDITGESFNVGSGGTYSVNRLVEIIGGESINIPKRPGEPDCTFADITKIRENLGWEPTVSFETGARLVIEHIEDWREAPIWTEDTIAEATADWFKYLRTSTPE